MENTPAWARGLKEDILIGVRGAVQDELRGVKKDVMDLTAKVATIENTAEKALKAASEAKEIATNMRSEMASMETSSDEFSNGI